MQAEKKFMDVISGFFICILFSHFTDDMFYLHINIKTPPHNYSYSAES